MTAPVVALEGVAKRYGAAAALARIDLAVPRGAFVVVLGPSGSGKTTLLSIIGGFVAPSEGRVVIDGADVTALAPAKRPTATVFQDYALFPHMSVAGNVGFGLAMHGVRGAERRRRVEAALALVGLAELGRRGVHQLSGGQQQRVALARAIAVEPKVLLLDEPLGALDLALRRQMQDELSRIQRRLGTTFLHVTHDQDEAMSIADEIVLMHRGAIEDRGPPRRVYLRPRTRFAATFMGESNLIEGRVVARDRTGARIETPLGAFTLACEAPAGARVTLVLRPEHIALDPPAEGALALGPAHITAATFQGTNVRLTARAADGSPLLIRVPPGREPAIGATVPLHAAAADVVVLPGEG